MGEESFWDREAAAPQLPSWLAQPKVREYVNKAISGGTAWPLEWFKATWPRRYKRGLSIGCGTGALERGLLDLDLCEHVDAFDASSVSLAIAQSEADKHPQGSRIRYFQADFNTVRLPTDTYDLVLFHQSLHHVARIERLLRHVARALQPEGLLYLEEYIGPSRGYWTQRRFAPYAALYQMIPREMRWFDALGPPINYDDPTEAIRSGEIVSRIVLGFEVAAFQGYGGNVLSVLIGGINPPSVTPWVWDALIQAEQSLLAAGAPHFNAVIVAKPKRGVQGLRARIAYLFAPKWRRLRREIRTLLGRPPLEPEELRFLT